MAERDDQYRDARDLGSRSPASEEAKEQNMTGQQGAPRGEGGEAQGQPAQASGRRGEQHEQRPEERKGFAPGQAPSEQGEHGSPSPEQIAKNQQGIGRQGGSHSAHGETAQQEAMSGEPREGHTRHADHGRQGVPGGENRPQE